MSKSSKKFRRRRSSIKGAVDMTPAIVLLLTEMSDNICGISGYDPLLLAAQTSKILALATSEGSERKSLMHKSSSGLSIILKTLKVADSLNVVSDIISLLHVLTEHKYTVQLVRRSVVSAVMVSLSDSSRSPWCTDTLLLLHLSLLNKLSASDKRFAVKARLTGILVTIVGLLKKYQEDYEKLSIILRLLQSVASNSVNAEAIGKLGCISILVKLLTLRDLFIVKQCINVLGPLLKPRCNATRPASQACVKQLVLLHEQLHHTDPNGHHILLRKKILNCLKSCISRDVNLQTFQKCNGLQILYTTAVQSSEGARKGSRSIASLTCAVLRKCLPPLPLPLSTLSNPVVFPLPLDHPPTTDATSASASSSTKTTVSDLSAQLAYERAEEGAEEMTTLRLFPTATKKLTDYLRQTLHSDSDFSDGDAKGVNKTVFSSSVTKNAETAADSGELNGDDLTDKLCALMAKIDLDFFGKFFPEINASNETLSSLHFLPLVQQQSSSLPSACNPWLENSDSELRVAAKPPPVVVPTAIPTSERHLDMGNKLEQEEEGEEKSGIKVVTNFVEQPAPQVLGHVPLDRHELMYSKSVSVDRKLYLSDIARITSPKALVNKVVYDLDELVKAQQSQWQSELANRELKMEKCSSHPELGAAVRAKSSVLEPHQSRHSDPGLAKLKLTKTLSSSSTCVESSEGPSQQPSPSHFNQKPQGDAFDGLTMKDSLMAVRKLHTNSQLPSSRERLATQYSSTESDDPKPKVARDTGPNPQRQQQQQNGLASSGTDSNCPPPQNASEIQEDLEWDPARSFSSLVEQTDSKPEPQDVAEPSSPVEHLEFESRFESGNLRRAIQVRQYEYDLLLNSDINTSHHHQWFYFRVTNNKAGVTYRFNIINCEKPNSQFNFGMQPLMFSSTAYRLNQQGWIRTGTKISYYSNNYVVGNIKGSNERVSVKKRKTYYTMTFSVVFQHESDTCYFAYHYPYTYSMLLQDLESLEEEVKDSKNVYYKRQSLCTTLCGNVCPLITISDQPHSETSSDFEVEEKKYVVVSARVHPGESNSSWIMRGLLRHLISTHPNALMLREKFVFKIIPMLNPDGVIHGSHRCSLSGEDLNRQWINPDPSLHPTIYYTKGVLQWLVTTTRKPEVFCDIHGHSRRKNIFMYGCRDPSGSCVEQVLPRHLNRIAPFFSYNFCSFAVEKPKEATARVVVWKELGVAKSYTMESTYCGADQGQHKGRQIGTSDLEEMGTLFCAGLQRQEEQSGLYIDEDAKDSLEFMTCQSDSSNQSDSSDDDCISDHSGDGIQIEARFNVSFGSS